MGVEVGVEVRVRVRLVGAWVEIRLGVGVRPYEWGTLGVADPIPGATIWVEAGVGVEIGPG